MKTQVGSGAFTDRDVYDYIVNFNYSDLHPKSGNFGLAPVQGGRFVITSPSGVVVNDLDPFPNNKPNFFGIIGKVNNPGVGLIEFSTPSGYLIQFSLNLEFRLNY